MVEDIHVLDCGGYYTVCNKLYRASPDNHSHFWIKKAAYTCKTLVDEKVIPKSPYMVESALRVSIDEKYKACIRDKYNIPHDIDVHSIDVKPMIEKAL